MWAGSQTVQVFNNCSVLVSFSRSSGLSGAPGRWTWADGRSVSFSRLRGAPPSRSQSDVASDCVLVENPRSWISTSCSPETQHWFICSSPAHTHWANVHRRRLERSSTMLLCTLVSIFVQIKVSAQRKRPYSHQRCVLVLVPKAAATSSNHQM